MEARCETCGNTTEFTVDGYNFGDRLLEGVIFDVSISEGKAICSGYNKSRYTEGLNMKKWIEACNNYLKDLDTITCKHCGEDVAGPYWWGKDNERT